MAVKITDLVDQQVIDRLKELDAELLKTLETYTQCAKALANGLDVNVKVVGDIEKLEMLLVGKGKEAAQAQQQLTKVIAEQGSIIAKTTPVISRQLMEQERVNKITREAYTEQEKVKRLIEQFHDTYSGQIERLATLNRQLSQNKKEQSEVEKMLKAGRISSEDYVAAQQKLIEEHRRLSQEKRTLNQLMSAEEKMSQATEGSYVHLSQQLELLKKAYKGLNEEQRGGEYGQELEATIQNLDAHLKDMAADMGEFQRNVGNYAIAGRDGIVTTESLMAVLNQQAITTKDLVDQSKILTEARGMLDTKDVGYANTLALINTKLEENSRQLTDVSDIMGVEAKSVAEAEAQNQRLVTALKNVDVTRVDSQKTIEALNAKIEANNKMIAASGATQSSLRKDLREMVYEIANLTIQYQNLSDAEKSSAEGEALSQKIQELTEKAGVLKDAVMDANAAITNAASDTRTFDQISEGIQLCIDGFGLASGAAQMLGLSEDDLVEVQTKLQAAIAASNAMTQIQNALQKQSALMQGTMNLQTKAGIIAMKLKTAAEGKGIVTTKLLTAAQWLFNAAAKANPIGLLVTGVMTAIGAVTGLIKVFNIFGSDSEKRKQKYKEEAKALEDLEKYNDRAIEQAKARGLNEYEASEMAIKARFAEMAMAEKAFATAKSAYDEDKDEYKEALDKKNAATEKYAQTIEDSHNNVLKFLQKYNEKSREEALGTSEFKKEVARKEFDALYSITISYYAEEQKAIRNQIEIYKLVYGGLISAGNKTAIEGLNNLEAQLEASQQAHAAEIEGLINARNQRIKKADEEQKKRDAEAAKEAAEAEKRRQENILKEVRAARQKRLNLIEDLGERSREFEKTRYEEEKADLEKRLNELGEDEVVMRQAIEDQLRFLAIEHERNLAVIEQEGEINRLKVKRELINLRLSAVEEGTREELSLHQTLIQNELDSEIAGIKKRVEQGELTEEEGEKMIVALKQKYDKEKVKLAEDYAKKEVQVIQKKYADQQAVYDNEYVSEANALSLRYAEALKAAKGDADKQLKVKEAFERDKAKLADKYAMQTSRTTIEMYEKMLKEENLTAEERQSINEKLAKAKADMETKAADIAVRTAEGEADAYQKAQEDKIASVENWSQAAMNGLNAINDLIASVYDAKMQKVEEEQEANTAAGEAEAKRISELVDKNVITEEEGEARKRAAEAKTAKKNDELEKKKQKIKHKQAVWDKANAAAQVGINTALAMMKLWVQPGWPTCVPMMAVVGGLGALQLATILATPIPKYAKGTDRHKGGPAIVGDGGVSELVVFGNRSWLTPDKPTLVDLPEGAKVIPDVDSISDMMTMMPIDMPKKEKPNIIINNDFKRLEDKVDTFMYMMDRHFKRQHDATAEQAFRQYISRI